MPLIDYTLPGRLCCSFSFLLLSRFFMILFLSCSAAQLLNCVQRQSKTPAVNHGHGENKSRSPDTGGVHSTADDRTLIKNGCTEHRELGTGTQPSPARPDQTTVYPLFTWPDKIASATLPVAGGRGTASGRGNGDLKNRRTGFTGASANLCAHARRSRSLLGSPIIN